jgi:hypothetical protein
MDNRLFNGQRKLYPSLGVHTDYGVIYIRFSGGKKIVMDFKTQCPSLGRFVCEEINPNSYTVRLL